MQRRAAIVTALRTPVGRHAGALASVRPDDLAAHKISRADQDQFALQSQQRWSAAHQRGKFAEEIVPVEIPQRKGAPTVVSVDEHPRPTRRWRISPS
jgi:acetyl-CoA acetyltransferase